MIDNMYTRSVMERIEVLATYSEESNRLTRRFATEAMQPANNAFAQWMGKAGMPVHQDNISNLIGRYEANHTGAKTFITSIAMLFVRCKGGISHHPAEAVAVEDVAVTITVLTRFLELLARKEANI